jgi:RNA polymerase sigma-70 factor (ECF subfamily)
MGKKRDTERDLSDPVDWVTRYGDYLYRYALVRLRDPVRAEDMVQETFLSALRSRKNFKRRSSEKTWLIGILRHKIIDDFRRMSRERPEDDSSQLSSDLDQAFDENGKWRIAPPKWDNRADAAVEQKEFWEIFDRCVSKLPPILYGAFSLREIEELSTKEICKELDITSTNLLVRMHRARRLLKDCLESNWFGVSGG